MALISERPEILAMYEHHQGIRTARSLRRQRLKEANCIVAQRWSDHLAALNAGRGIHHGGGEEVIAWVSRQDDRTPTDCFSGWLSSPPHAAWLLDPNILDVGYGVSWATSGTYYAGDSPDFNPPPPPPIDPPLPPPPTRSPWLQFLWRFLFGR